MAATGNQSKRKALLKIWMLPLQIIIRLTFQFLIFLTRVFLVPWFERYKSDKLERVKQNWEADHLLENTNATRSQTPSKCHGILKLRMLAILQSCKERESMHWGNLKQHILFLSPATSKHCRTFILKIICLAFTIKRWCSLPNYQKL